MNWVRSLKKDAELNDVGGVRFKKSLLQEERKTADMIANNILFFI
jgi:hypothetical protein